MARINIEDKLLIDPRFKRLARILGDRTALGTLCELFRLAQTYWCQLDKETGNCLKQGIPKHIFEVSDFPKELFDFGLVFEQKEAVFVRGASEHFAWLVAKTENGKKGGRPNKIEDLTKATESYTKANESYGNPPTPIPILTPIQNNNIYAQKAAPKVADFDLNLLYEKYPRKEGKSKGLSKLKSSIKTKQDFDDCSHAIDRYKEHLKKNQIEPQFYKHFSTFVTSWRDWLDPQTGTVDKPKEKSWMDMALEEQKNANARI